MNNNTNKGLEQGRLHALIDDFRREGDGTVATLRRLAAALNAEMRPMKTWKWNYLNQVDQQKIVASKNLQIAINRLYAKRISEGITKLQPVVVLAPVGFAEENSILMTRTRRCAREGCRTSFIPNSPHHIFCSPECRKIAGKGTC